jgi:hypothetical protein
VRGQNNDTHTGKEDLSERMDEAVALMSYRKPRASKCFSGILRWRGRCSDFYAALSLIAARDELKMRPGIGLKAEIEELYQTDVWAALQLAVNHNIKCVMYHETIV